MTWIYLICFILLSAGIVLLLGLTPEIITDDLMGLITPKENLRDKVLIAQGKKKSRKLTREIYHIKEALDATGKANQFTMACAASVVLMIVGCIFSVMIDNFFMIPVAAVIFGSLPFFFARTTINAYDRQMKEELETALSIVTTSYIRTDDILGAVTDGDRDPLFLQGAHVRPLVRIGAADRKSHAVQHFGQRGHRHATDPDQMAAASRREVVGKIAHVHISTDPARRRFYLKLHRENGTIQ